MGYCCSPAGFVRWYPTNAERVERLEAYADHLERELTGVRERIAELKQ